MFRLDKRVSELREGRITVGEVFVTTSSLITSVEKAVGLVRVANKGKPTETEEIVSSKLGLLDLLGTELFPGVDVSITGLVGD